MSWSAWGVVVAVILGLLALFEVQGGTLLKWLRKLPLDAFVVMFPGVYRWHYSRRVGRLKGDDAREIPLRLARARDDDGYPLLVPRRHLFRRKVWPHWSYGILVLFQDDIATVTSVTDAAGYNVMTLSVDISNDNYGIYRNAGKSWLESHSLINPLGDRFSLIRQILLEQSTDIHQQMLAGRLRSRSESWSWRRSFISPIDCVPDPRLLPLRWSSGGALPFVRVVDNRQIGAAVTHIALFYRDLDPIGWNVANGASECEEELADFDRLTTREFSEELRVYSKGSGTGDLQEILLYEEGENVPYDTRNVKNFGRTQRRLRLDHDGIQLTAEDGVRVVSNAPERESPFVVNVTGGSAPTGRHRHSVVFTLNPFELGCEVLWLARFDLLPGEFILDGEVDATNRFLIRRPVILISVDFLRKACTEGTLSYNQRHVSTGNRSQGRYVFDQKYLQAIPKGQYKIFDEELQLGRRRTEFIAEKQRRKWKRNWYSRFREALDGASLFESESGKDQLAKMISEIPNRRERDEFTMRLKWQIRYGALFKKYVDGDRDITDVDLLAFCPTTWKALELVFSHKLLERLDDRATVGTT
jgi:hypothetical protein